ncbi:MAG: ribosomal-processing cysteine protease Prp, partial [Ureaplasma sp.]|nr:ribosomal-processing cysteine protease Prp [Ureaplasma sp.]
MIKIDFYQNGYIVSGHANYSNNNDIVCAGVSSITIGSINWFNHD